MKCLRESDAAGKDELEKNKAGSWECVKRIKKGKGTEVEKDTRENRQNMSGVLANNLAQGGCGQSQVIKNIQTAAQ